MKSPAQSSSLLYDFRQACTPPTRLERLQTYLEAAVDCANDRTKDEEIRLAETVKRVRLIASYCDETTR